jgi:hypothetical protein
MVLHAIDLDHKRVNRGSSRNWRFKGWALAAIFDLLWGEKVEAEEEHLMLVQEEEEEEEEEEYVGKGKGTGRGNVHHTLVGRRMVMGK